MIKIIGGTYQEYCFEPFWDETFGSGLRACLSLIALNKGLIVEYYTFGDNSVKEYLETLPYTFPNLTLNISELTLTPKFYYDHPLAIPSIYPRLDTLEKNKKITIEGDNLIFYGMIEGQASVKGRKVVYDPQSPANPFNFSQTGSTADSLAIVVNLAEASLLSKSNRIADIKDFFLHQEKAEVLILKQGPKGASVFLKTGEEYIMPVYKTDNVWPIGSGDVFTAVFAYHWFNNQSPYESATKASLATADFCNSRLLQFPSLVSRKVHQEYIIKDFPKKGVYLAGPFFTFSQRWLVDQIRSSMLGLNMNVFSPFHDVGHGFARDVVHKDIEGLDKSGIVFAILDGLDSGTLFEVGYAVSKGIPVIAYVQNEGEESVKMLEGTNCILEKDLTTAIYKTLWILSENE